jgi:hypothetical protein
MRADQPVYSNTAADRRYLCGITGTGASNPTSRYGNGITPTRTAQGVYRFSFASHPGYLKAVDASFGADTPSAVKGYSFSRGLYVAPSGSTNGYVEISVWDASNNAVDLAALQYMDVELSFSELSTG